MPVTAILSSVGHFEAHLHSSITISRRFEHMCSDRTMENSDGGFLPPLLLRLRGGEEDAGDSLKDSTADDERKRKGIPVDGLDDYHGKRPRVDTCSGPDIDDNGGATGNRDRNEVQKKGLVRIPREVLKKLRAVVKEVPPEGMAVARFVDRYQELYRESLKATASTLGFGKVTAFLSVLPTICNCSFPPPTASAVPKADADGEGVLNRDDREGETEVSSQSAH